MICVFKGGTLRNGSNYSAIQAMHKLKWRGGKIKVDLPKHNIALSVDV